MTLKIETGYERDGVTDSDRRRIRNLVQSASGNRTTKAETRGSVVVCTFDGPMYQYDYDKLFTRLTLNKLAVAMTGFCDPVSENQRSKNLSVRAAKQG